MPTRLILRETERSLLRDGMLDGMFFSPVPDCPFPVFSARIEGFVLYYTPGYLVAMREAPAGLFSEQLTLSRPKIREASLLIHFARSAAEQWEVLHRPEALAPFSLTVYTSQRCNLNCAYCFSRIEEPDAVSDAMPDVSRDTILSAAEIVAQSCRRYKQPFSFVLHGGGEPLLDPRLPELMREVSAVAAAYTLPFHSYVATNGVTPESVMRWVAETFDEIGLSCDGPDDLQNGQRPLKDGRPTADAVRRSARILKEAGKRIQIRATVTAENFHRIPDIVTYAAGTLGADTVRIEPVFGNESLIQNDAAEATAFCEGFLQAKEAVAGRTCEVTISGSRIETIHGRYCQIFRHVLQLIPGDGASACFLTANQAEAARRGLTFDPGCNHLNDLAALLRQEDPECEACFNRFHCSRGCPDRCPAAGMDDALDHGSFRCRVNRTLAAVQVTKIFADRLQPLLAVQNIPYVGVMV